ncbi:hypothetical protein Bbelb_104190 [Branchiostoma belcheri]|nr:hypothetical protein Bbelb_104190 [Branchiostoma belcheri]
MSVIQAFLPIHGMHGVTNGSSIRCTLPPKGVKEPLPRQADGLSSATTDWLPSKGALSDWVTLSCGVAQGTLLGPILFLVLIDDAASDAVSYALKYVDDMNFLETRSIHLPSCLQNDLDQLHSWTMDNHMLLNSSKCMAMHITFCRNPPLLPPLRIDSSVLSVVPCLKILGLRLQSDLRWNEQVNHMSANAARKLFILKRLRKFNLSQNELLIIYTAYIRPLMEYAVPVWSPGLSKQQVDQLERIQRRACRIIMGPAYTGYASSLEHLKLTTLAERRETLCLNFARSLIKSEFEHWLPSRRSSITGRSTRNAQKLDIPKAKTQRYRNSPIPYLTRLLNQHDF